MSYPILYSATETNFDHNGIGILSDCISCDVTEESNGIFELTMQYPMDGIHFENITDRVIIKAKSDQFREPQLFRVYAINRPMNGIVSVLAEHISYDLSGIPVKPFSATSVYSALSMLKSNAVVDCPFDFWTDKTTQANFKVSAPASIRSRLGGVAGSILDVYGGEYEFDNYTVKLHNNRGMNRGVSIRYGKNLTDIQQEQNCSSVATGVYPYWAGDVDGNTVVVELPEKIINAPGTYNFVKIRTLDLSSDFEAQPTVEQLRSKAESYVKSNNIGIPNVSMTVSFAQLEQSEEYKGLKLLERVSLFDTVNVEFPALGVSATAKAVNVVYDVLSDRVKSVTLGSVRANIADTIAQQQQEIQKIPTKTFLEFAVENLTKTILGAKGGSVRLLDANEDGEPDTLYIADNADPNLAKKVWRFNYEGWGASDSGYNGPFKMGATLQGGIVADFITAGTLYGILIKAGAIESVNGKVSIDLNDESRNAVFNSGISTNSFTLRGDSIGAKKLVFASSDSINGKDTIVITFQTSDGRAVGALSHTFHGSNQVGIQYRAFNTDVSGVRKSGVDIRAGEHEGYSESGFFLLDGTNNDKSIGHFRVGGDSQESEIVANHSDFGTIDIKNSRKGEKDNAGIFLMGGNGDGSLRGWFKIGEDETQESEIVAQRANFDKLGGKSLFWRLQSDGTYALMGRD